MFHSLREAADAGIATIYQDLALVPIMPIHRSFVLGASGRIDLDRMVTRTIVTPHGRA